MINVEALYKRAHESADHVAALQAVYAAGVAAGRVSAVLVPDPAYVPPASESDAGDEAQS